jgi:hypothetical protein
LKQIVQENLSGDHLYSSNYYEDVSSDEDIFDIQAKNEEMDAENYD